MTDKPSKPKTISIKDIEAESVNVFWEPPSDDGGVDISKYSLEKCEVGKMIWTKVRNFCHLIQKNPHFFVEYPKNWLFTSSLKRILVNFG